MDHKVCPIWVGCLLLNPLRRLIEDPYKLLGKFVQKGMIVLEPGCGMGYFTLPLARMVGPQGRVFAVEIQAHMLSRLRRRAERSGLLDRIETRQCSDSSLGIEDLDGCVDFAAALHLVHEVPNQAVFFDEVRNALRPMGRLFMVEPKRHVKQAAFEKSLAAARNAGFEMDTCARPVGSRSALLIKS
jgi:ubiquinone/menaquinone biosynthesis C-methylase UbiE